MARVIARGAREAAFAVGGLAVEIVSIQDLSLRSSNNAREPAIGAPLQESDDSVSETCLETIPNCRVRNDFGAEKRRTQARRMRHFSAQSASHATLDDRGDGIFSERIRIGCDRKRRAAGQPDAGVIASASVSVYAELQTHHTFSFLLSPGG